MTERIINYSFSDNLIKELAVFLNDNFKNGNKDFSRVACIFGGKRPALFLKRELSRKIGSFIPPRLFSMDEFIDYLAIGNVSCKKISDMDAFYIIYNLSRKYSPAIVKNKESFIQFLPWAREIFSFIEQLDCEDIPDDRLAGVEKSASIGFDVPASINNLLKNIVLLRKHYHAYLEDNKIYSRGWSYLQASKLIAKNTLGDFDAVIFVNLFYLQATEQKIVKDIYGRGKGYYLFQGPAGEWPLLFKNIEMFAGTISPESNRVTVQPALNLYQGFDIHSQTAIIRQILEKTEDVENTVVVLPRPQALIPLLAELPGNLKDFNVSMGYPLESNSLFSFFSALFKACESKKDDKYYTKDYLEVLKHPLVKNLRLAKDTEATRVLIHKLEEILTGQHPSSISGSIFLSLPEIENEGSIFKLTRDTLGLMDIKASEDECRQILAGLNKYLFTSWEGLASIKEFCCVLGNLINLLVDKSIAAKFPFNVKVIGKLLKVQEELSRGLFGDEEFDEFDLWKIFLDKLKSEVVSFSGSPLRGTQILGLLETRSLNFNNVIVMDMNESVIPKIKIYEPLIPREVMIALGLNRLEAEEEIQRYHFMRLIGAAKNIHLIYEENQEREKSRFIEELLWKRQKNEGKLEVIAIPKASFNLAISRKDYTVSKTNEMVSFLKNEVYSASRINTYLDCPLKFYYKYVLGLEKEKNILDDPEADSVGSFIHEFLHMAFRKFEGGKPDLGGEFKSYFFDLLGEKFDKDIRRRMKADAFLLEDIIRLRMEKFFTAEKKRTVSKIIGLEKDLTGFLPLDNGKVAFKCTVDRIDELSDGRIAIIDYKTGGSDIAPKGLKELSLLEDSRESIRDSLKSFQLPIYYYFVSERFEQKEINAFLYNIRNLELTPFISDADYPCRQKVIDVCCKALRYILGEIFDIAVPFVTDKDERRCQYCYYGNMCE